MNQTDRVLDYIKAHGSITQMDATNELGISRLASRVHDLRAAGFPVTKQMEKGRNRLGDVCRYARYSL